MEAESPVPDGQLSMLPPVVPVEQALVRRPSAFPPMGLADVTLLARGYSVIAGVDEVGVGPLAGPVVAAAVVLGPDFSALDGLRDSKQLSPSARNDISEQLTASALATCVVSISAAAIDEMGIRPANLKAMTDAVLGLDVTPDAVLVDARTLSTLPDTMKQYPLVKGDQRSYAIAAASILAKVTRDNYMRELAVRYPEYGFATHKGYGTRAHRVAIAEHGPCPAHRRSFTLL